MQPITSVTKVDQARFAILSQIFSGDLKPGDRLVEARLARGLGVSQATVNAALQDLHAQGIVTKVLNRSTNVSRYTLAEIESLFAVRLILEPAAAAAAARILDQEGVDRLRAQVDAMRRAARARSLSKFYLADYTFHQDLYQLARNSFLCQACQAIAAAPFAYLLCGREQALPTDYLSLAEDHQDIILSLENGPSEAERVARTSIEAWRQLSLLALKQAVPEAPLVAVT